MSVAPLSLDAEPRPEARRGNESRVRFRRFVVLMVSSIVEEQSNVVARCEANDIKSYQTDDLLRTI